MIYSLAFLTLQDCDPIEAIHAAADAGYQRIGLRLLPATPEEPPYPLLTDDRLLAQVRQALADTGLEVGDVELIRLKPDTEVSSFEPFLERAGQLGAKHVIVVNDEPSKSRFVDAFSKLCELAAPYGLTVDLEPMTWTATKQISEAHRWIEQTGCDNAGILIDALHFHRGGCSIDDLKEISPDRIHLFQICDALKTFIPDHDALKRVSRSERLLPGQGELDLRSLLRHIPAHATLSVEVPNSDDMRRYSPSNRALRAIEATKALTESASDEQR